MLMLLCRQVRALGGNIAVEGVSPELGEIADCAGFGDLLRETVESETAMPISVLGRRQIDAYPTHQINGYSVRVGRPFPMGATPLEGGVNFAIYSRHATAVSLVLFAPDKATSAVEIPFPAEFRVGDVFAMVVFGLDADNVEYGFRMDGPCEPSQGRRFDKSKVLLDPQAHSVAGHEVWGGPRNAAQSGIYRGRLGSAGF